MERIGGVKKAAILLMSLPASDASVVLRYLRRDEVEQIAMEIANTRRVERSVQTEVLEEFHQMSLAQTEIAQGGIEAARVLLERAFDGPRANDILHRLSNFLQKRPFEALRRAGAGHVVSFIQNEHPQIIAVILAYMDPMVASQVLSQLPEDLQGDVARRIAVMGRAAPEVVKEVEALIEKKLSTLSVDEITGAGGINSLVPILNNTDRNSERLILGRLEEDDPELAEEIRARMFVFENLVQLEDRAIQKVLRRVDTKTLALALKGTPDEVSHKIYKNLSQKATELLKDDIQVLGPVRIRDVEQAQREIIGVIRVLEDQGELVISRGEQDDYVV